MATTKQTPRTPALTNVHVDLPNHWAAQGESFWALPLGGGRYELRNVPFYAYNLNFGDVVVAVPAASGEMPQIRGVIARSGHRTIRLRFADDYPEGEMFDLLATLQPLAVTFERASPSYFALDLEPACDIGLVRGELDEWEQQGWIDYETCEERAPGSFDDAPSGTW